MQKSLAKNNNNLMNVQSGGNMSMAINSREVARIQGEIYMAKQFPRDMTQVLRLVESDCLNANLADQAVYQYARGGTSISGPSIRLAEVLAKRMGNFRYGFEEVENTGKATIVRCYAYDIESNSQAERTFAVPHIRHTRSGDYELTDPRDIYELVANNAQRRVRACILEQIPGDIVDRAVYLCSKTIEEKINLTQETRNVIIDSFKAYGVTKKMIEMRIQRSMDAITPQHVVQLRQILKSIKDGVGDAEDFFDLSIVDDVKKDKKAKETKDKKEKKEPQTSDKSVDPDPSSEDLPDIF